MTLRADTLPNLPQLLTLYGRVGWTNYTRRPERLQAALRGSLVVLTAWEGDALIGLARAVGDGVSILFVQDVLVDPAWQRQGVGRALMQVMLERFPEVYQVQLLADRDSGTEAFYRSLGFRPAEDMGCMAFLRMKG